VHKPAPSPFAVHWDLDPAVTFLNHGSFGGCPRVVVAAQRAIQDELEREPVRFLHRELEQRLDVARDALCEVVDCDPQDLVFVRNATEGVNTVLRSLQFAPGDELLTIDHEYNATQNAMRFVAERSGARVVVAHVPFPIRDAQQVVDAVLAAVTPRTKLLVIDHITSPTGIVLPIERLVRELDARGIDTLIDGAHGPGMVPLSLRNLGAAYYTGNCHKWLFAPKGCGFLWARADRQEGIHPAVISHGYGQGFTDSISQHWGDRPLEDLQKGWAHALSKYSFLDGGRACALGGSYGGFMVNWIAGNWNQPWKCLVNHDGIFDARFMGYSTEELWFSEWENGGTPWTPGTTYEKFNPANFVQNWRVPELVIHGGRDFRVPLEQGIATFTALQRKGVDSKFLYFPEENHWVLKAQNSVQWHDEVMAWLNKHAPVN
jgi:pimeloyl-ACP methyl ester carboxylesterase